jgi:hypothetical protein
MSMPLGMCLEEEKPIEPTGFAASGCLPKVISD